MSVVIRLYRPETDAVALGAFNEAIFGSAGRPARAPESVQATELSNPYGSAANFTVVAVQDGDILGHLTSTPFRLWVSGEEREAWWLSGFHVLPAARRLGLGRQLVACMTQSLSLATAVVVVEPSLRAFLANGWRWPGKIPEHVRVLRPRRVASVLNIGRVERFVPAMARGIVGKLMPMLGLPLGWGLSVATAATRHTVSRNHVRSIEAREVEDFGPEIDDLWLRSRAQFGLTYVRSSQYINWMFPASNGWRKRVFEADGVVEACAIYAIREYSEGPLAGLKALNVVDLFWNGVDGDLPVEAMRDLVQQAQAGGADVVMASGSHPQLRRSLRAQGFLRIPATVFVGFWDSSATLDVTAAYASAYITRGYADAAGQLGPV